MSRAYSYIDIMCISIYKLIHLLQLKNILRSHALDTISIRSYIIDNSDMTFLSLLFIYTELKVLINRKIVQHLMKAHDK